MAVVVEGGRFLLIRRGPGVPEPGYWAPVSGTVEPGEEPAAAVVREVREEVGLEVRPLGKVWECVSSTRTHDLDWWIAVVTGGTLRPDPREVSGVRWVRAEEFAALERTFPGDAEFFSRVLPVLTLPPGLPLSGGYGEKRS